MIDAPKNTPLFQNPLFLYNLCSSVFSSSTIIVFIYSALSIIVTTLSGNFLLHKGAGPYASGGGASASAY